MTSTLSFTDRVRRWSYLQDVELWLDPMSRRRRREVIRDLRTNLADAAADVGMAQAIDDLGRPRALAREFVRAEPRRRPTWTSGVLIAGAVLIVAELAMIGYVAGMTDTLLDMGGGIAHGNFLGIRILTEATDARLGWEFAGWSWPITIAVALALLLGARVWRYLPPRRTP